MLNALYNTLQYERFKDMMKILESFPEQFKVEKSWNIEGLYYLFWYMHQIKMHFLEGTFSDGIKLVAPLMEIIEENKYNWDDRRVLVFYYRIACLYFGSGDNDKAIDYLNLIINQKNPDYREDIQSFARILNLIAHFELGNRQLVEYQVKSVYRFLAKLEDLHEVQKEIFYFLRKTPRMRTDEIKDEFVRLKGKLTLLEEQPYTRRPFLYLDIISWLESKIENRSVQEVIREKFLAREAN
jgi:tetratricopeptide (TPR) repeat protein